MINEIKLILKAQKMSLDPYNVTLEEINIIE